jgi:FKBP-type peptidyl-prolyl cis-trans isomerase (trigger factor)
MKTEVKKLDSTRREISVEVSGQVVKDKYTAVFAKINKEAKVRGFRSGHLPQDILEKNFASQAHDLVLKELVPDVYNQAVEKEGLEVLDLPNITDVKLDHTSLSFKATVEVTPEIKLKPYKGLTVKYKKLAVTADEIKRNLDSLKETKKTDVLDGRFARSLGYATLAEFEEIVEKQIFIQKANLQREKIEEELIESLTKDTAFKIPEVLVSRQLEDLVHQAKLNLAIKGIPPDKIKEEEKNISEKLRPQAQKQVQVYLILAEIAKKENIALDEHMPKRVMELLLREADWKEEA